MNEPRYVITGMVECLRCGWQQTDGRIAGCRNCGFHTLKWISSEYASAGRPGAENESHVMSVTDHKE